LKKFARRLGSSSAFFIKISPINVHIVEVTQNKELFWGSLIFLQLAEKRYFANTKKIEANKAYYGSFRPCRKITNDKNVF